MSTLRVDNILPYTSGSTITIAGFSTAQTPTANDFINVQSYGRWVYGVDAWSEGSKWNTMAAEVSPTDYLKLTLIGGQVNGQPIHRTYISASVNSTNLVFRDDGFGSFPVNYVDFINGIFEDSGLYTRITGSLDNRNYGNNPTTSGSIGFTGSYCAVESFNLIFLEKGRIDNSNLTMTFYILTGVEGIGIFDSFRTLTTTVTGYRNSLPDIVNRYYSFVNTWYQPSMPGYESYAAPPKKG